MEAQIILPTSSMQGSSIVRDSHLPTSSCFRQPASSFTHFGDGSLDGSESNPLRMLRTGAFPMVRPKGKSSNSDKLLKVPSTAVPSAPSPSQNEDESSHANEEERWRKDSTSSGASARKDSTSSHSQGGEEENPIPLPPRDRSKPSISNKPRHQRKHPLVIPQGTKTFSIV